MDLDILILVMIAGFAIMGLIIIVGLTILGSSLKKNLKRQSLTTSKTYDVHVEGSEVMPEVEMSEVEKDTREMLRKAGEKSAKRLNSILDNTVDQVNSNINEIINNQISQEFEKYQISLQALRDQSITEFTKIQKEIDDRKKQLMEHLEAEIEKEKKKRMDNFNERLNDVVSAYLTESLGSQVDLGAQSTYIFAALEQHKEDIKRDVVS